MANAVSHHMIPQIHSALRSSHIASSSRHIFQPRSYLNLYNLHSTISIVNPRFRSLHIGVESPLIESSSFPGIPTQVYVESVEAPLSSKGKGKETSLTSAEPSRKKPDIRAKKNAITMTPTAITRLRTLVSSPTEPKLLRIGVKSRGCAGMAYHLDYVSPPGGKFDEVVEQDGVRVLIDSKALFSIIGSRMDWRDNRLSAGFVFDNPNVVDTCGCGESFNIHG